MLVHVWGCPSFPKLALPTLPQMHTYQAHACMFPLHTLQGTWKLRSTEDVFAALEDNSVALSSMKASKYYLVFEKVGLNTLAFWCANGGGAKQYIICDLQRRGWKDSCVQFVDEPLSAGAQVLICLARRSNQTLIPAFSAVCWTRVGSNDAHHSHAVHHAPTPVYACRT